MRLSCGSQRRLLARRCTQKHGIGYRKLPGNGGSSKLIRVDEPQHDSIAEISERKLVELLLSLPHWRDTLLSIHGFPSNPADRQRVPLALLANDKQGDVDVLLCAHDHPEACVAIEVKRVKVRNGTINKLGDYEKAVRQANQLEECGFAQVWLFLLIQVDSRRQNAGRVTYDGFDAAVKSVINQKTPITNLRQRVGVMHWDFTQPMNYPALTVGAFGGRQLRGAELVEQPASLTQRIAKVFAVPQVP